MKIHKNSAQKYLDNPGNRPRGIPNNAKFAAGGSLGAFLILVPGFVVNYLVYKNESDKLFVYGEPTLFILIAFSLIFTYTINSGRLVFVKLLRYFCSFIYILYILNFLLSIFQIVHYNSIRNGLAVSNLALLTIIAPFIYLMHRDLKRSRWLDPTSLPHEWEIPAINDPTSLSYRPPKKPR